MTPYVALLRAVNVGGTGKLAMSDLRILGEALGFAQVRTFIASGNLLFEAALDEATVKAKLEERLAQHMGKPVPVLVRTADELEAVVQADPFPDAHPSRHLVYFYDAPPAPDFISHCRDRNAERLSIGVREVYIDYGDGIRHTRLKLPPKPPHTARSINSVRKMAALLQAVRGR